MKYFLDTEFSERGSKYPIQLISIGIVAEDGRWLYAVSKDFDPVYCNDWVKENVFPNLFTGLPRDKIIHANNIAIASHIRTFIFDTPEIWGYYADYDWVVFCQLFGAMIDLPKTWPMYCRDLKQWCDDLGNPELPKQDSIEHNALHDAEWNKHVHYFLTHVGRNGIQL